MIVAVYDTNVIISGTFWLGAPQRAIWLAKKGAVRVVTSESLLSELFDVLSRPEGPFRLSTEEAKRVVQDVRSYACVVRPIRKVEVCRDPGDNAIIECALAGGAQYIVTGDADLLSLGRFEDVEIVNVSSFISALEGGRK